MIELGWTEVLLSIILVAVSLAISFWWKIPVQKDMALGSVRAFLQLVAVGYALKQIFDLQSVWLVLAALLVMILVGAHAAAGRLRQIRRAFTITFIAMTVGSAITLSIMLVFDIITMEARYIIPLGGMIISNAMNASALTAERIASDIRQNAAAVETALALGKSWRAASRPYQKAAVVAGMLPILNFLKTVGIVALPGAMTGMILAGVEPIEAILLQIIVAYMLVSAVTITSVVMLELVVRRFFTPHHQLAWDEIR